MAIVTGSNTTYKGVLAGLMGKATPVQIAEWDTIND